MARQIGITRLAPQMLSEKLLHVRRAALANAMAHIFDINFRGVTQEDSRGKLFDFLRFFVLGPARPTTEALEEMATFPAFGGASGR